MLCNKIVLFKKFCVSPSFFLNNLIYAKDSLGAKAFHNYIAVIPSSLRTTMSYCTKLGALNGIYNKAV